MLLISQMTNQDKELEESKSEDDKPEVLLPITNPLLFRPKNGMSLFFFVVPCPLSPLHEAEECCDAQIFAPEMSR
jgi:hypothetical protein